MSSTAQWWGICGPTDFSQPDKQQAQQRYAHWSSKYWTASRRYLHPSLQWTFINASSVTQFNPQKEGYVHSNINNSWRPIPKNGPIQLDHCRHLVDDVFKGSVGGVELRYPGYKLYFTFQSISPTHMIQREMEEDIEPKPNLTWGAPVLVFITKLLLGPTAWRGNSQVRLTCRPGKERGMERLCVIAGLVLLSGVEVLMKGVGSGLFCVEERVSKYWRE